MSCLTINGQNARLADSLKQVYESDDFKESERLHILKEIAYHHPDPDQALSFSNKLLSESRKSNSIEYEVLAYLQKGNALRLKGDVGVALESYFRGVELANRVSSTRDLCMLYISMANTYSVIGNRANTILYYNRAIELLKSEKDSLNYASVIENLGDEYNLNFSKPDSALLLFEESGAIFKALDYRPGIAYNLGNKGLAYAQQGKSELAEANLESAINMLTDLGDYYPICVYLIYMSDEYAMQNKYARAFGYARNSLELAQKYRLKDQIAEAYLKISELSEQTGDIALAYDSYKEYINYRDSVKNLTVVQNMANTRVEFEIAQKQIEVDLLNQQKKNQQITVAATGTALGLIGILALGVFRRNRYIKKTNRIIEEERDRTNLLLQNILPVHAANELKKHGKVTTQKFESVTILFTDFQGFTEVAENLSPEDLVKSVDYYYSNFDRIIEIYGLEKIKTIGDSYMCAGGLPTPTDDHALRVTKAAIAIKEFMIEARRGPTKSPAVFDVRIGINTGYVVAGVVGTKKFAYDIWGDAVNIASRMESSSEIGEINVSEGTYDLIKNDIRCQERDISYRHNSEYIKMFFVREVIAPTNLAELAL